jgi:DNA-binding YbaB/EbfC family protein
MVETPNIQHLMQLTQQMQTRVKEIREQLERNMHTGMSGGGVVQVTVDGKGNIKRISIAPAVVDPNEVEMLEDLIVAGAREAQGRAREELEREMSQAAGGLPLSGLEGLLG